MPFELEERFVIIAPRTDARDVASLLVSASRNGGRVFSYDDVWDLHPIVDTSDRKRLKRSCNDILHDRVYAGLARLAGNALAIASNGDRLLPLKSTDGMSPLSTCGSTTQGNWCRLGMSIQIWQLGRDRTGMPKGYVVSLG